MTVKSFFKSNVFKCLVTLLCVLLVSGVFLTIMNGLLAVSDQERLDRAINKIYGKSVAYTKVDVANYNDSAEITEAYRIKDDGNYLVKSTGKGGFENGTVTCWVVVIVKNGSVGGVQKVVVDSNKGQSYIGNINDKFLSGFYRDYESGYMFNPSDGFIKTGATRSATAICNAVNGALDYVNAIFGNVTDDPYAGLKYSDYIDTRSTTHKAGDKGSVVFSIKTKGYGSAGEFEIEVTVNREGAISDYKIIKNGSTDAGYENKMNAEIRDGSLFKDKTIADIIALANEGLDYGNIGSSLQTGATNSNYLCLCAAAFAAENYEKFLPEYEAPDDGDGDNPDGDSSGSDTNGEGGNG